MAAIIGTRPRHGCGLFFASYFLHVALCGLPRDPIFVAWKLALFAGRLRLSEWGRLVRRLPQGEASCTSKRNHSSAKKLQPPQSSPATHAVWTSASLFQTVRRSGACSGACWSAWFLQFNATPGFVAPDCSPWKALTVAEFCLPCAGSVKFGYARTLRMTFALDSPTMRHEPVHKGEPQNLDAVRSARGLARHVPGAGPAQTTAQNADLPRWRKDQAAGATRRSVANVRGSANVGLRDSERGGPCVLAAIAWAIRAAETGLI